MWLINKIGNIKFTIVISIILMILLTISTSVESLYGTTFVQNTFYQTRWFDFFLSLLWLNIFCSVLKRYPFKRSHIGFLFTHIGIMGFLLGALLTRLGGIEGQLALYEGSRSNRIKTGGYELSIKTNGSEPLAVALAEGSNKVTLPIEGGAKLDVQFLMSATESISVVPAAGFTGNRGVKIEIQSKDLGLSKDFWLTDRHPAEQHPSMAFAGPLQFVLSRERTEQTAPHLRVLNAGGELLIAVDLSEGAPATVDLGGGHRIENLRYYTHARVFDGKIVNHPESGGVNPAVEFDVKGAGGETLHVLKFAFFPDFASMHGKSDGASMNLSFELKVPETEQAMNYGRGMTVRVYPKEKDVEFDLQFLDGRTAKKTAELNQWTETGWMGTRFRVLQSWKDVDFKSEVVNAPESKGGVAAARLMIRGEEREDAQWITEGQSVGYRFGGEVLSFQLQPRMQRIPFYLKLEDFRKHDYPGTSQAAAYESDVVLSDPHDEVTEKKMISMNNPLDYKGFRVFQSSFAQSEQYGEASIFTVSKNPGIPFIYISSFSMCFGAMWQFYGRQNRRRKNKEASKRDEEKQ